MIYSCLFFKFYWFSVNFTSCIPIPLISPCSCFCPLPMHPLQALQKKKSKTDFKRKIDNNKQTKEKNLAVEVVVWPLESYCLPFSWFIFICKCSFAMNHSGFGSLASALLVNNWLSLGFLLNILLLSLVMQILQFWICRFIPFTC